MSSWTRTSWQKQPIKQVPTYPDQQAMLEVCEDIEKHPPLIFAGEARRLKSKLAEVAQGKAFLLQGGDCAESFAEFRANDVRDTLRVLMQMAVIMMYGSGKSMVKLGRMAGQFAKPRSSDTEQINGHEIPSYRGDMINDIRPELDLRVPDPKRMMQAYNQSAATLNLLRAFTQGGYADLHRIHRWTHDFISDTEVGKKFFNYADDIKKALKFMEASGIDQSHPDIQNTDFYTSHECLHLWYEQSLTREDSTTGDWVCGSGHFLWIGDRTRQLDGAHVEFLKGVLNPIGMKCGPSLDPDELIQLIDTLNPKNEPGRLTLITRMGAEKVQDYLPKLVERVKQEGREVVWSCDPMHGNTFATEDKIKTRDFDKILSEIKGFFEVHRSIGTYPGGIHLEMTGRNVTECVGGSENIRDHNLHEDYATHCDPRLNASQSIELAFLLSEYID